MTVMTEIEFSELINKFIKTARETAPLVKNTYPESVVHGNIVYMMTAMYVQLDDKAFIKEYFPERIKELIDDFNQQVVMDKLES